MVKKNQQDASFPEQEPFPVKSPSGNEKPKTGSGHLTHSETESPMDGAKAPVEQFSDLSVPAGENEGVNPIDGANGAACESQEIGVSISPSWHYRDESSSSQDQLAALFQTLQAQGFSANQLEQAVDYVKDLHDKGMAPAQISQLLRAKSENNRPVKFSKKVKNDLVGTRLGNYQIFEFIAKGGMSEVYKAVEQGTDKIVACKFLLPALTDVESSFERFKTETKALQKISSRHSVKVFDSGQYDGRPYMILEFIRGRPLNKVISESEDKHLSVEQTLDIVLQICDVLEEAHKVGIVHRDLKPSNIMLLDSTTEENFVKVLDFGIAKVLDDTTNIRQLTNTGEYIGSVPYSSPEQCQGLAIDGRTDIYSLACLIFEALLGFPPFQSPERLAVLFKHVNEAPPSILLFLKHRLATELDPIISKCLAKDPDDRYPSIAALRQDLQRVRAKDSSKTHRFFRPLTKVVANAGPVLHRLRKTLLRPANVLGAAIFLMIAYFSFYFQLSAEQRIIPLRPCVFPRDQMDAVMNHYWGSIRLHKQQPTSDFERDLQKAEIYRLEGNLSEARDKFQYAAYGHRSQSDQNSLFAAEALAHLAYCYIVDQSDISLAQQWAVKSLQTFAISDNAVSPRALLAYAIIGQASYLLGDRKSAEEGFQAFDSISFGKSIESASPLELALGSTYSANYSRDNQNSHLTKALYTRAIADWTRVGKPAQFNLAATFYDRAIYEARIGDGRSAASDFENARNIFSDLGSEREVAKVWFAVADADLAEGKLIEFIEARGKALQLWSAKR
jgi:tRNA A-37 threonylcarbamoyl transferase component Bud32/tetratricopeptide (TPR) repeat protein